MKFDLNDATRALFHVQVGFDRSDLSGKCLPLEPDTDHAEVSYEPIVLTMIFGPDDIPNNDYGSIWLKLPALTLAVLIAHGVMGGFSVDLRSCCCSAWWKKCLTLSGVQQLQSTEPSSFYGSTRINRPRCAEAVDTSTDHAELMRAQVCKIHMPEAICLIPSMIDVFHLTRLQLSRPVAWSM